MQHVEEIGEFWDTHSLADYWDETHEVEFQVNLKSRQNLSPDEDGAADQRTRFRQNRVNYPANPLIPQSLIQTIIVKPVIIETHQVEAIPILIPP